MDKLLFEMPQDPEAFLAALANVQAFVLDIKARAEAAKTEPDFSLTLIARKDLWFLLPAIPVTSYVALEEAQGYADQYDLVFSFNEQVAYKLSLATEKHITQAFGLLLGANPDPMPDLSRLIPVQLNENVGHVLIRYEKVSDASVACSLLLQDTYSELDFSLLGLNDSFQNRFEILLSCSGIVGMRSFETYVAACLKKYVVELYPATRHRRWLSKWSCKTYQMVYGPDFSPTHVVSALETIWRRTDSAACQLAVAE